MKILVFTSLFPNSIVPRHGIFVENRLKRLKDKYPDASFKVVCPIPWFPLKSSAFGEYGNFARVEKYADRGWAEVYYPRYPVIPKIGMNIAPFLMRLFTQKLVRRIRKAGFNFDLIDAHYFYPDGVAAVEIAKREKVPVLCTARGNDISLISQFRVPDRLIARAIKHCDATITVCKALAQEITTRGYKPRRMEVLRNGVDLDLFKPPANREALREQYNLKSFTLLSVGHHIERKGHHLVIEALQHLPEAELLIAGDGPMQQELVKRARDLRVDQRVTFLGAVAHEKLAEYYGIADVLVLASSREGWANVLLEAMACGTPVIATNIWGTPEVVQAGSQGILVERKVSDIVTAVKKMMSSDIDRGVVRAYAEHFSWDATIDALYKLFGEIIHCKYSNLR